MNENWTELKIKVPAPQADIAGAIANMVVPYGIYMEDYSHLEEEALEIAHIDLIDEELLQKDREHAIIHPQAQPVLRLAPPVAREACQALGPGQISPEARDRPHRTSAFRRRAWTELSSESPPNSFRSYLLWHPVDLPDLFD